MEFLGSLWKLFSKEKYAPIMRAIITKGKVGAASKQSNEPLNSQMKQVSAISGLKSHR
jgi:hypothetical protein